MPLYSHSRLSTYEKCPLQYRYRYLDRIKRDTQSIEAFMGNRVHEALEKLYRDLLASKRPSLDELLASYHTSWDRNFSGKVTIVRTEHDAGHYRSIGEECIAGYYRRYDPFDDGTTIGLEEQFTLALDAGGRYQLQGYIDRLVRLDAEVYEIHDYKTSNFVPSDSDLRRDRQLTLYRMAMARKFPQARQIRLVWHYLAKNRRLTSDRTPDEMERYRRETIQLIDVIEVAKDFAHRESPLCGWCEYRDICPAFAVQARPETRPPAPIHWLDKAVQIRLFE